MSSVASMGSVRARPSAVSTKSFARFEPVAPSPSPGRSRASTIQSVPPPKSPRKPGVGVGGGGDDEDVFDHHDVDENQPETPDIGRSHSLPDRFDELPIELASLADRFVESLSAKTWTDPPTIDHLSSLFQEFYVRASSAIAIHISALKSRLGRDGSPAPSKTSPRPKTLSSTRSSDSLAQAGKIASGQQMLTASEVTEKRRQRRLLEFKRLVLEEAVEKRVCEKIYDKLWRHKSTLDEVRDEKLRSKTAALALVGIGLKDLGIEAESDNEKTTEDMQVALIPAREGLAHMNDERCPLGKLQHLTAAHKAIVDALSTIHSSSSSADEVLPTLIYTLISSPVEGINVISNLNFIQRFRWSSKIDGEAAYCLTNLEAAISFLEDVDLSTLRADERPQGPEKTHAPADLSTAATEKKEPFPPLPGTVPTPIATTAASDSTALGTNVEPGMDPLSSPVAPLPAKTTKLPATRHQRTFSDLLAPISNANDAVRSTAEEGFKNISNTLDNSFKFLLGKLKERGSEDAGSEVIVPKTLDEARQLVSRPMTPEDDDHAMSESSSIADGQNTPNASNLTKTEDRLLSLLGGRRSATVRDASVDSVRSNGSTRRLGLAPTSTPSPELAVQKPAPPTSQPASHNPLESVKNFGTSLNPIGHIGSAFNTFTRFGQRAAPLPSPPITQTPTNVTIRKPSVDKEKPRVEETTLRTPTSSELATIRASPPIPRFMVLGDASELKLGEVETLLADYQRLARVLGTLVQRAQNAEDNSGDHTPDSVHSSSDEKHA